MPDCTDGTYAKKLDSVHSNYTSTKERFKRLSVGEQESGIQHAWDVLQNRLKGNTGDDLSYVTVSSFSAPNNISILKKNDKVKILICPHCFFDNPHGYGGMLFLDFYEWLCFLGEISEQTNYEWYIKVHPDPLPGTIEIIEDIFKPYPRVQIIPGTTSHKQPVKDGIDFILTAYGTVGFEYPLLGKQVINAGYNPRVAYDSN